MNRAESGESMGSEDGFKVQRRLKKMGDKMANGAIDGSFWNRSVSEFNTSQETTMIWWELQNLDATEMTRDALKKPGTNRLGSASTFIFLPNHPFKLRWDLGIASILTFSVFSLPFRIAFIEWKKPLNPFVCPEFNNVESCKANGCDWVADRCNTDTLWLSLLVADTLIDFIFLVDVVFSFRSAYYVWKKGKRSIVTSPREIALHYVRTWFVCDVLASLPLELISLRLGRGSSNQTALITSKLLRLVNLAKMLRILKVWRVKDAWAEILSHATMDALVYLFIFVVIAHAMACFLFWVGTFKDFVCKDVTPMCSIDDVVEGNRITWITKSFILTIDEGEQSIEELRMDYQYLVSMYWAFTVMTTVGYGDLKPKTIYEVWALIVCMLVGASSFSFVVGSVANSINQIQSSGFWQRAYNMLSFMHGHKLPQDLRRRINDFLHYSNSVRMKDIRGTSLQDLSPLLQQEITMNMRSRLLSEVPLFKTLCVSDSIKLLGALSVRLCTEIYSPGDLLFHAGDIATELFLIESGHIELVEADTDTHFATFQNGNFIGENGLLRGHSCHIFSAKSESWSIVFRLKLTDIENILEDFAEHMQSVRMMAHLRWTRLKQAFEAHRILRSARVNCPHLSSQSLLRALSKLHGEDNIDHDVKLTSDEEILLQQIRASPLATDFGKMLSLKICEGPTSDGMIEWDWSTDWVDCDDMCHLAEWFEQACGSSVLGAKVLASAVGDPRNTLDVKASSIAGLDNFSGYMLPGRDLQQAIAHVLQKLDVVEAQTRLTVRLDTELKRMQEMVRELQGRKQQAPHQVPTPMSRWKLVDVLEGKPN